MIAQALEVEMEGLREQHQTAGVAASVRIELLQQQVAERDGNLVSLRGQLASAEQTRKSDALQVYSARSVAAR